LYTSIITRIFNYASAFIVRVGSIRGKPIIIKLTNQVTPKLLLLIKKI